MKILLDFHAKFGRQYIFKPTVGNESLREDSNDNEVRVVNFATSKMDGVCSTYVGEEWCIQDFGTETWGKETTWKT